MIAHTPNPRDAEIAALVAENEALHEKLSRKDEACNSAINAAMSMPDPVREQLVAALRYARRMMKPDSDFAFVDAALLAAPRPTTDSAGDLLDLLANTGGMIVSTASLDSVQIAAARIEKRMFVRGDACGFVHIPPSSVPTKRERELDAALDQTIGDRDQYHEWADKLAGAIAGHFGVEIGEHSNQNCPWAEALEVIENSDSPAAVGAGDPKPVAWLRFWARQSYGGRGDIDYGEGLEVCTEGEKGDDGVTAFPVYGRPTANGAAGVAP